MCAQPTAARVGKQRLLWRPGWLSHPGGEDGPRVLAQRRTSFLASLADHAHMRASTHVQILTLKAGQLRQAQPSLNCQQEQRMVAASGPPALIWHCQQRIDLLSIQERHECPREALSRDGQHALDLRRM